MGPTPITRFLFALCDQSHLLSFERYPLAPAAAATAANQSHPAVEYLSICAPFMWPSHQSTWTYWCNKVMGFVKRKLGSDHGVGDDVLALPKL